MLHIRPLIYEGFYIDGFHGNVSLDGFPMNVGLHQRPGGFLVEQTVKTASLCYFASSLL